MTQQQILGQLNRLAVRAAIYTRRGWHLVVPLLVAGWSVIRPALRTAVEVFVALIIVFEEWGWRPLASLGHHRGRHHPAAALRSLDHLCPAHRAPPAA